MALVALDNVHFLSSGETILDGVSLQVNRGDRLVLIGRNGAGKTSLLELIAGELEPDRGSVSSEKGLRIGYLRQVPDLGDAPTVLDAVVAGRKEMMALRRDISELTVKAEEGDGRAVAALGQLQERYEREGGDDLERRATVALQNVGFDQAQFGQSTTLLSGGERSRLLLARILVMDADLLLLDEPTNHLDLAGIEFLEQYLASFKGGAVVVSHDRTFIDRFATDIAAIEPGAKVRTYPGGFEMYQATRTSREERERKEYEQQKDETPPSDDQAMGLHFPEVEHSGKVVFQVKDLTLRPGGQILLQKVSFNIERGDRVGIIGPSGCGKTTLLNALSLKEEPAEGKIQHGYRAMIGTFDQTLSGLTTGQTVLEELSACRPDLSEQALRDMASRFLFLGEEVFRKVETFSGGEQSRLVLALLVLGQNNVLLLDEPTNHLDIPSREVLEEALLAFPGTLVVVSHDRFFLDRVARRVLSFESRALVDESGTYSELRKAGKIMRDAPKDAGRGPDPDKQRKKEDYEKRRQGQRAKEASKKRIEELEKLVHDQEKQIEELMVQMADPARALDWEGLEKLQEEKKTLVKDYEANRAEWESLVATAGENQGDDD
jgi:ATP-binding cassette, subfamily F, member 3